MIARTEELRFYPGQRVRINYGIGTVIKLEPDASGRGRPDLVWVSACGQAWLREQKDVTPLRPDDWSFRSESHARSSVTPETEPRKGPGESDA